jgi:hypothetical protein
MRARVWMGWGVAAMAIGFASAGCHARLAPVPAVIEPGPGPAGNRPPTVKASADADHVAPSGRVILTAEAYDPDGDHVSLQWSAPAGAFSNPTGGRTYWTAPATAGPTVITVTADDGRGLTSSSSVTVTVADQ